ncbi:mitochondrial carrier domain-containing protein [Schizophyllum amplum]|uniref:Mitochondrial carrier domain-containing protein n=1 Tax=Schizophyllum amplum TaxID=97359 RepID=A0A550CV65_9AGAR|nr:mitochondrial carrier domain-containing protein [Auriculariopsis ampla]
MDNVGQQMATDALSGFASTICLQPFDLLKTRMQQSDGSLLKGPQRPSLMLDTVRQVIAEHGPALAYDAERARLFSGAPRVASDLPPALDLDRNVLRVAFTQLRTFMANAPAFSVFHIVQQDAAHRTSVLPKLTSTGNLIAGATTRVAVGFVLNPVSVLKARFESNIYAYETLGGAFVALVRAGPSECLRGFVASSLRDAPYAGLFVLSYEGIKRRASALAPPSSAGHAQNMLIHSISAASAGVLATLATHPFDVIETKIQVRKEDRYRGFARTCCTIASPWLLLVQHRTLEAYPCDICPSFDHMKKANKPGFVASVAVVF